MDRSIVVALLVISLASEVLSLKCYICNSIAHPDFCQEKTKLQPKDADFIRRCTGTCVVRKLTRGSVKAVERSCEKTIRHETSEMKNENGLVGFTCHCNTDLCNLDRGLCESPRIGELTTGNSSATSLASITVFIFSMVFQLILKIVF